MSEESMFEDFPSTPVLSPQNPITDKTTSGSSPEIPQIEISSNSPESFVDETLSQTKEAFTPVLPEINDHEEEDENELETIKIDEIEDNTPLTLIQQNLDHYRDFRNDDLKTPPVNCPESPVSTDNNNNKSSMLKVPNDETTTSKKSKRKRSKVRGDAFTVEFADEQPNNQPGSHFQGPDGPFVSYSLEDKEKFEKVKIHP